MARKSKILVYVKPSLKESARDDAISSRKCESEATLVADSRPSAPLKYNGLIESIIAQNKPALDKLSGHTEPDELEFEYWKAEEGLMI